MSESIATKRYWIIAAVAALAAGSAAAAHQVQVTDSNPIVKQIVGKNGADNPAGDVRHGRGADDPAGHA
jgi:hypothetical protein